MPGYFGPGALFALALALPAAAEPVTSFTLDNGLNVVVIEDHRAPVVVQMIWYRVGAADEPPGHSGIAHFLEHLMFKGHRHRRPEPVFGHSRSAGR
jgi:zinc protease